MGCGHYDGLNLPFDLGYLQNLLAVAGKWRTCYDFRPVML